MDNMMDNNMMDNSQADASGENILKSLVDLHQLDFDAVKAYEEAIERIENIEVKSKLEGFKQDHERHLDNLEDLIIAKGGARPDRTRDIKGLFIEGMTLLRSSMGDGQALKAMRQNEELTNKKYGDALKELSADPEVMKVLNEHYADEKKHLAFIREALSHPGHFEDSSPNQ